MLRAPKLLGRHADRDEAEREQGRREDPGRFPIRELGTANVEVCSMEKTRYEVVPSDGGWAVETGGKSTPPFPSKELAMSAATARAKQDSPAEVIVHAEDGSVEEELTV